MDIEEINAPNSTSEATEEGYVSIHTTRKLKKKYKKAENAPFIPGGRTVYCKSYGCGHNVSDGE